MEEERNKSISTPRTRRPCDDCRAPPATRACSHSTACERPNGSGRDGHGCPLPNRGCDDFIALPAWALVWVKKRARAGRANNKINTSPAIAVDRCARARIRLRIHAQIQALMLLYGYMPATCADTCADTCRSYHGQRALPRSRPHWGGDGRCRTAAYGRSYHGQRALPRSQPHWGGGGDCRTAAREDHTGDSSSSSARAGDGRSHTAAILLGPDTGEDVSQSLFRRRAPQQVVLVPVMVATTTA